MKLSIVVPALNEEASLGAWLPGVVEAVKALGVPYELIVVDGRSTDRTVEVARAHGARVVTQESAGFGGAVKDGLAAATGEWILTMDADGSHPPADIRGLWDLREGADLVIGSRWAGRTNSEQPLLRRSLSVVLNGLSRWWLDWDVRDASSGFRLYRAAKVKGLPVTHRNFSVQQELLGRLLGRGAVVREAPFTYTERIGGESKASVLGFAASYLRMFVELKALREGRGAVASPAVLVAVALVTAFWGLDWGLPGAARLSAFPERLKPTPEVARRFADSWAKLYAGIEDSHKKMASEEPVTYVVGVEAIAPGWDFPPEKLLNSYRSFLLRSAQPDERKPFTILARMRPWRLEFEPLYIHYGGAYIYPLGAFLAAAAATRAVVLSPDVAYYILRPEAMARLYVAGRLFILLFHWLSLWALYDLGKRLGGWKAGLAAALLFALSPVAAAHTHISKPHPYAAFWLLMAIRGAVLAVESGRARDYLLTGVWAGLAAGSNLVLFVGGAAPALAWAVRALARKTAPGETGLALAGCAAAAAACCAANPYLLFSYGAFRWELEVLLTGGARLRPGSVPALLGVLLPSALGCGGAALGLLAMARSLWRNDPRRRLLGLSALLLLGWFWSRFWFVDMDATNSRLFYPVLLLLAVLAGDLLARLPGRATWALALAACLIETAPSAVVYLENMRLDAGPKATRVQAAAWIAAHVPPGSRVGLTRYPEPAHTPAFRFDRYELVLFDQKARLDRKSLPAYMVVDAAGAAQVEASFPDAYALAAAFEPVSIAWGRVRDAAFYANGTARVYALKGAAR